VFEEKVIVKITPEGGYIVEVQGGKGKSCTDLTKLLVADLGVVIEQQLKPEAYQAAEQSHVRQGH